MMDYDETFYFSTAHKSFILQGCYVTHDYVKKLHHPQIHLIMEKIVQLELENTQEIHQFRTGTFLKI